MHSLLIRKQVGADKAGGEVNAQLEVQPKSEMEGAHEKLESPGAGAGQATPVVDGFHGRISDWSTENADSYFRSSEVR